MAPGATIAPIGVGVRVLRGTSAVHRDRTDPTDFHRLRMELGQHTGTNIEMARAMQCCVGDDSRARPTYLRASLLGHRITGRTHRWTDDDVDVTRTECRQGAHRGLDRPSDQAAPAHMGDRDPVLIGQGRASRAPRR